MWKSIEGLAAASLGAMPDEGTYAAATQDSCRALVLSGGASNGAWDVGVLYGLVNYATPSDYEYDVVTGVSVGSINALFLAGYPKGQEVQMVEDGSNMWNNLKTSDVWKNWPLSYAQGLMNKQGFLDNSPLLQFIKDFADEFDQLYKRITVSALNF